MDSNDGEESQYTSENEVNQSVSATSRRPSDVELQLQVPENESNSGSYVWKHFTKDPNYKNNRKASCNYCNKIYICSAGTTSGISKHLQKFHARQVNNQKVQKSVVEMLNEAKVKYVIFILLKNQILLILNVYL